MVDKLRMKKEGLKTFIFQILSYIHYSIFLTILWSRSSYSSSTGTKRIGKVGHLAQGHIVSWQGQILKPNLLALRAVYTVPKQNESVSEIHFGRKVLTRDRNKTGGPGMHFMCG